MSKLIGRWDVLIKSMMGDKKAVWEFTDADGKITGTLSSEGQVTDFETIDISGDDFILAIKLQAPIGLVDFKIEGIATDSEIIGDVKMKMGKAKITGKRIA